ncbi:MAG TPA: hypothetical protein VJ784_07210 [Pyrinomonadaceae bacterium]|nr:hypothetical protein [Pyrinomonadaceae bacterium]
MRLTKLVVERKGWRVWMGAEARDQPSLRWWEVIPVIKKKQCPRMGQDPRAASSVGTIANDGPFTPGSRKLESGAELANAFGRSCGQISNLKLLLIYSLAALNIRNPFHKIT